LRLRVPRPHPDIKDSVEVRHFGFQPGKNAVELHAPAEAHGQVRATSPPRSAFRK
jgi:hypothetical protein